MHSAPVEVDHRFRTTVQLLLIEQRGFVKRGRGINLRIGLMIETSQTLTERQATRQLDKAKQVAALPAAVAVEDIFSGVDLERRPGFLVQWA